MSESRTEDRLDRLEADMREVKATLGRLEPLIIAIHTTSGYLATKAELAAKPNRVEMWTMLAIMLAGFALIIGVVTWLR